MAVKEQDVETAVVVVVAVAHKPPVVTVAAAVGMAAAKVVADAVVITTLPVHKAHAVPSKATAVVVVKAADAHLWVTRNRVATKAVSAAAWASVLPAAPQAVNLILCAPVSI